MACAWVARKRVVPSHVQSVRRQLGHMFSNLTNMVAEQAEVAREIEENMNLA